MSSNQPKKRRHGYHHQNVKIPNRIRVRSKRLDQVDEDKLSLAFWLLAKQLVEDQSDEAVADTSATDAPDESTDGAVREAQS